MNKDYYHPDTDDMKLLELHYNLWHDIQWKLKKIRYSMPPSKPDNISLGDELEDVIIAIERMREGIKAHVTNKAKIKRLLEKLEKLEKSEEEDAV